MSLCLIYDKRRGTHEGLNAFAPHKVMDVSENENDSHNMKE